MVLWVHQNLFYFSVSKFELIMTDQFEDCKCEIVARLVAHLIIRAAGGGC
jgi:hypothetical protein